MNRTETSERITRTHEKVDRGHGRDVIGVAAGAAFFGGQTVALGAFVAVILVYVVAWRHTRLQELKPPEMVDYR